MEKENMILTMEYTDGSKQYELLTIFEGENEKIYAALKLCYDEENNIELVRLKPYKDNNIEEDYILEEITTETELEIAKEAFKKTVNKYDEFIEETLDDLLTLTFEGKKGKENYKVINVFEHNKRNYIALISTNPSDLYENEDININLMRLELTVQNEIEGCEISPILSDMEYEEVSRIFESRVNESISELKH